MTLSHTSNFNEDKFCIKFHTLKNTFILQTPLLTQPFKVYYVGGIRIRVPRDSLLVVENENSLIVWFNIYLTKSTIEQEFCEIGRTPYCEMHTSSFVEATGEERKVQVKELENEICHKLLVVTSTYHSGWYWMIVRMVAVAAMHAYIRRAGLNKYHQFHHHFSETSLNIS